MASSSSSIFLAPGSQTVINTSAQLSVTPPRKYQPPLHPPSLPFIARSTPSQALRSTGRPRALSTNADVNGEQGRITMQTRVAVRDTTPHRFQIIPLREAKNHRKLGNTSEPQCKYMNDSKRHHPIHHVDAESSPIPTLPMTVQPKHLCVLSPDKDDKLLSTCSISHREKDDAYIHQVSKCRPGPTTLSARPSKSTHALLTTDRSAVPPSVSSPHPVKPENAPHTSNLYPSRIKHLHQRNTNSEANTRNFFSNSRPGPTMPRKARTRACSEDLTHCKALKCAHERLCPRDDPQWRANKRHAIYADALVLPLFDREIEFGESSRRVSLASTSCNAEADWLSCHHSCVKLHCFEDTLSRTPGESVHGSPRMVSGSQSETIVPTKRASPQPRPSTECFSLSPISHLRPVRKPHDSSTFRARAIYNLRSIHERPVRHSEIILELLRLLDQAIEDWYDLGRDYADYHDRICPTRNSHL